MHNLSTENEPVLFASITPQRLIKHRSGSGLDESEKIEDIRKRGRQTLGGGIRLYIMIRFGDSRVNHVRLRSSRLR